MKRSLCGEPGEALCNSAILMTRGPNDARPQ